MKYSRENSFNCKSLTYYKYNCQNILNSENYSSSLKKKKKHSSKKGFVSFAEHFFENREKKKILKISRISLKKKNHLDSLDESLDVHDLRRR